MVKQSCLSVRVATSPLIWRVNQRCPGDADRLDQRVRDRTGLLTAVNFSSGKDMPERHDSASPLSLRVKKNIQEEH
ncbi:hypothetical protein CgunFtcFv8_004105 [Champsocephalus gunnari]|uniref:Uncharacterized protein n=1 Tax=Champsocephalus gunnari TaxID=52237 RepID=A0AAN8E333_CHAGU|nr:hypothetical protein CgunFtcFv8_004105 [Champsocephalus gunnari]